MDQERELNHDARVLKVNNRLYQKVLKRVFVNKKHTRVHVYKLLGMTCIYK